jgi:hypothetical protein
MTELTTAAWLAIAGLGSIWLGWQILVVAGLPRALRGGDTPTAEAGTPEAFGLFWLDQYAYIGLTLTLAGVALVGWSVL